MAKCPKCNGTGFVPTNIFGVNGAIKCDFCDGSGVFITNAETMTEQTNEEWFDGLSTEEKAKVFANATYSTAETPLTILWGGKEAEQKKWELWLKQPHQIVTVCNE